MMMIMTPINSFTISIFVTDIIILIVDNDDECDDDDDDECAY